MRPVPRLAELCEASIARNAGIALARAHTLPVDERCFAQLTRALSADRHALDDRLLDALLRPGFEAIDLSGFVQVTSEGLRRAAPRLARTRRIALDGIGATDAAVESVLSYPAQLLLLSVSRCRQLTDGSMLALARRCLTTLTSLDISHCKQLTDAALAALLAGARALEVLDASMLPQLSDACYRPAQSEAQRRAVGRLRVLRLRGCRGLTDAGLAALLADATSLEELDLALTAAAEGAADTVAERAGGTLRALELTQCAALPLEALPVLLVGCAQLTSLDLSRCPRITSVPFAHSSHSLLTVRLSFCELEPAALGELASSCPQLTGLAVRGCARLLDETVFELAETCSLLEDVDLAHCPQLTDHAVRALAVRCPRLRSLALDGNAWLSDEAVEAVAEGCVELAKLALAHCSDVGDPALHALARHSHFVRSLDVSHCERVSGRAIVHFARHCAGLQSLALAGSPAVTADALAEVLRFCPLIRSLDVSRCALLDVPTVARITASAALVIDVRRSGSGTTAHHQ